MSFNIGIWLFAIVEIAFGSVQYRESVQKHSGVATAIESILCCEWDLGLSIASGRPGFSRVGDNPTQSIDSIDGDWIQAFFSKGQLKNSVDSCECKLSRDRTYVWEPNDRIKSIVDSQFGTRDFGYDELGNLAWASKNQEFTFRAPDAVGNLFRTGEQGDRKYGPGGQLLEAKTKDGLARYAYDAEGNLIRKEVQPPGSGQGEAQKQTWSYHWNALGQLVRVVRPDGREVKFTYDPLGRRIRKVFGTKTTHWVWDGNVPLHEWVVEKESAAAKAAVTPPEESAKAAEARRSALLASQPSQGPPAQWPSVGSTNAQDKQAYDLAAATGVWYVGAGGKVGAPSEGRANGGAIGSTSEGAASGGSGDVGNATGSFTAWGGSGSGSWSVQRLLSQPVVAKVVAPEPDATERGTEKAPITWLFEPESFAPMAKLVGERTYSILTDHLGTPYMMADAAGKEVWSADVDVYGARVGGTGHAQVCPFRFPGQYEDDETGLYYNRFRYYDPEAGNYVSQDPIGLLGGDRLYGYVGEPNGWVDPNGLASCKGDTIVIGEGMGRVRRAVKDLQAQGINAKWYQTWGKNWPKNGRILSPAEEAAALKRNERWIKSKIKQGFKVFDIGPDGRPVPSKFYQIEKKSVANYPTTYLPGY